MQGLNLWPDQRGSTKNQGNSTLPQDILFPKVAGWWRWPAGKWTTFRENGAKYTVDDFEQVTGEKPKESTSPKWSIPGE